jgi:hypothetical protein
MAQTITMSKQIIQGEKIMPYTIEVNHENDDSMYSCHVPEYGIYYSAKNMEAVHKKANVMVGMMIDYLIEKNNKK